MGAQRPVAVVTGAGIGIGRALAIGFSRAGMHIVAAGRTRSRLSETVDEIQAAGGSGEVAIADVREAEDFQALAADVRTRHGAADVVVANSGVAGPTAPLWQITPDEWRDTLETNLTGVYVTARAFLPDMIERRSGNVVVIGSMTGKRPLSGRTPYAASKLGLVGLVRSLALEVGEFGVRVNLISPGAVAGPRLDRVLDAQARLTGQARAEIDAKVLSETPTGRFVEPEDIASCALYLASDAASSITGQDINVTGGVVTY